MNAKGLSWDDLSRDFEVSNRVFRGSQKRPCNCIGHCRQDERDVLRFPLAYISMPDRFVEDAHFGWILVARVEISLGCFESHAHSASFNIIDMNDDCLFFLSRLYGKR